MKDKLFQYVDFNTEKRFLRLMASKIAKINEAGVLSGIRKTKANSVYSLWKKRYPEVFC